MNVAGVLSAKDVENVMLLGTRDKAMADTIATTLDCARLTMMQMQRRTVELSGNRKQ